MKQKMFLTAAALVLLFGSVFSISQVKLNEENQFIKWKHIFPGLQLGSIAGCDFSPDESILAVVSDNVGSKVYGYITFIETESGNIIDSIKINDGIMFDIKFYNDSTLIVGYNDLLRFYNIHSEKLVREIKYFEKFNIGKFPDERIYISEFAITNDKQFLAVSTKREVVVLDLKTDSVLMEIIVPDKEYYNNLIEKSLHSLRFINKKKTFIFTQGENLFEYNYLANSLINKFELGKGNAFKNLDVSVSEDFVTYAPYDLQTPFASIIDLRNGTMESIKTGGTFCYWSNFLFNDKYLHLSIGQWDTLFMHLYSIENKSIKDIKLGRKDPYMLRSKKSNNFIQFSSGGITLINGNAVITDVKDIMPEQVQILRPNPAGSYVEMDVILSESGTYFLKLTNISGKSIKEINMGYLDSGINKLTIPISELRQGIYLLSLTNNKQIYTFKLVKE